MAPCLRVAEPHQRGVPERRVRIETVMVSLSQKPICTAPQTEGRGRSKYGIWHQPKKIQKLGWLTKDGSATDGHQRLAHVNNPNGELFHAIANVGVTNAWAHRVRESVLEILIAS